MHMEKMRAVARARRRRDAQPIAAAAMVSTRRREALLPTGATEIARINTTPTPTPGRSSQEAKRMPPAQSRCAIETAAGQTITRPDFYRYRY